MQPSQTTSRPGSKTPPAPPRRPSDASSLNYLASGNEYLTSSSDKLTSGTADGIKRLSRPVRSPRRPSSNSNLAAASSSAVVDPPRTSYGLPSPPQTSSETSGGSVSGSVRLPSSVLHPPDGLRAEEAGFRGVTPNTAARPSSARRLSVASSSGSMHRLEEDVGRNKRLSDLRERSAKILNSLSSRRTPSPTKAVDESTTELLQAFAATRISSPRPSALSSPRHSLSGEETERAHSASSQASSPFSERGNTFSKPQNGLKKDKRVSISSSASSSSGWSQPPAALARGHERSASVRLSREHSSESVHSRESGRTGAVNNPAGWSRHRPSFSSSSSRSVASPPSSVTSSRRARETSSPSSSAALSRSYSITSDHSRTSSRGSTSVARTPLRSTAAVRVRPSSGSRRMSSDEARSPILPAPESSALSATPSFGSNRSLSLLALPSPSLTATRVHHESSPSSSSSRSQSSASTRPPLVPSSPLVEWTPKRPGKERQTSAEEVEALLAADSQAAFQDVEEGEGGYESRQRERTASGGKHRAPLPSEFTSTSALLTPVSSRFEPRRRSEDRVNPSPSLASLADRPRPHTSLSRHSMPQRHTPYPEVHHFAGRGDSSRDVTSPGLKSTEPSLRSKILRTGETAADTKPRYFGRGGSAESALARKPPASRVGGLGIDFPSTERGHNSRSDDDSDVGDSRASRTRSLLRSIERETVESERRTREMREAHAVKRAESSMSFARDYEDAHDPPVTPAHRRELNGFGTSRGGAFTGLPIRPSTSMSFTSEAPKTAPPLGVGVRSLRSYRSNWNLHTPSAGGDFSVNRDGSPSPSLVRRRKLSGEPSNLGDGGLRRGTSDSRSYSSRLPPSSSVHSNLSNLSSFTSTAGQQTPRHIRSMLLAFEALERHLVRLSNGPSTADVVRAAQNLVASVEQTDLSLVQADELVMERLLAAEDDDQMDVADSEAWEAMAALLKDAMRVHDEEVRASTSLLYSTLKATRELGSSASRMDGGIRRSETADWTSSRHRREASEPSPLRTEPHARPSTSMGYATISSSPSMRLRDNTLTRERLASIPSSRTLNILDVDVPREAPSQNSPPASVDDNAAPPPRRSSILSHDFDRFAPRRSSEEQQRPEAPERTWRQSKTYAASTVRPTSLFPSAAKVSPAVMAVDHAVANPRDSPERTTAEYFSSEHGGEEDGSPAHRYLSRSRTMSLASSSPMAKQLSSGSNSTLGGHRTGDLVYNGRQSFSSDLDLADEPQPWPDSPKTSPIASLRRLSLFGGSRDN